MNFNNVLKNKYLYYVAVALMVINVLGYVSLGSIECVLVLGGAAYLANQFTKNRTVDIFIGLFVSNILFGCGRLKEGFDNDSHKNLAVGAAKKKKEASRAVAQANTTGDPTDADNAASELDASKKADAAVDAATKCKGKHCKKKAESFFG